VSELEALNGRLAKDLKAREQTIQTLQEQVSSLKATASGSTPRSVSRTGSGIVLPSPQGVSLSRLSTGSPQGVPSTAPEVGQQNAEELESLRAEVVRLREELDRKTNGAAASPGATSFTTKSSFRVNNDARMKYLSDEITTWKLKAENAMTEAKTAQKAAAVAEAEVRRTNAQASFAAESQARSETLLKKSQSELAQVKERAEQATAALKEQLKKAEGDVARLASEADKVRAHATSLQRKIDALLNEKSILERSLADAQASAMRAKDDKRAMSSEKEGLAMELEARTLEVVKLLGEVNRMKAAKDAADAQFEALTEKLQESARMAAVKETETQMVFAAADKASDAATSAESHLKAMRERAEAAELAAEALRSQLALTQSSLEQEVGHVAELNQQIESLQSEKTAAELNAQKAESGRQSSQDAQSRLQSKVDDMTRSLAAQDATIQELTTVLDEMRSEMMEKTNVASAAIAQANQSESARSVLERRTASEMSEMRAVMDRCVVEAEEAREALKAAEEEAKEAIAKAQVAHQATLQVKEELVAAQQQVASLQRDLQAEVERAEELADLLSQREEELASMRRELSDVQIRANQADSLLVAAENDQMSLQEAEYKYKALSTELSDAREEITAEQQRIESAQSTIKELERTVEQLREEVRAKEARIAELQAGMADVEDAVARYESQKSAVEIRVSDAKSLARDYELKAEDARRNAAELADELTAVKAELEELKALRNVESVTAGAAGSIANDVKELAEKETTWKRRVEELTAELTAVKEMLHTTEDQLETERKKSASLVAMQGA
jgi:chromosome segregation ATPase